MSTTTPEMDVIASSRLRTALVQAGFEVKMREGEFDNFDVPFAWETMGVSFNHGVVTVARVMPSGNITAQAEFRGWPMDMVITAVVALASEMSI